MKQQNSKQWIQKQLQQFFLGSLWHLNRHLLLNLGYLEAAIQHQQSVLLYCPEKQLNYCTMSCRNMASTQLVLQQNTDLKPFIWNVEHAKAQILWIPVSCHSKQHFCISENVTQTLDLIFEKAELAKQMTGMTLMFQGSSGNIWNPQKQIDYPFPFEKCMLLCDVLERTQEKKHEAEGKEMIALEQELNPSFTRLQKLAERFFCMEPALSSTSKCCSCRD